MSSPKKAMSNKNISENSTEDITQIGGANPNYNGSLNQSREQNRTNFEYKPLQLYTYKQTEPNQSVQLEDAIRTRSSFSVSEH